MGITRSISRYTHTHLNTRCKVLESLTGDLGDKCGVEDHKIFLEIRVCGEMCGFKHTNPNPYLQLISKIISKVSGGEEKKQRKKTKQRDRKR
ncbi:hypothetical protein Scep_013027 [Stephania cephalantha]|uniref:Uncharacterized protein n=1 Tax=Stephania cephalantha TaxID=152367 RepID=A0AAP0JG78_9MAGN